MKHSPILISLDSNEAGSERAKALALACGGDPTYELQGFAELPVDMKLELTQECPQCHGKEYPDVEYDGEEDDLRGTMLKQVCGTCGNEWKITETVNVELKEISDFWASKSTGHLGQQVLEMVGQGQPGFVAVFGSLQEVLAAVPKLKAGEGKPKHRSQMDIASDISTARAFCADASACNIPVFFLSSNHQQSFAWILSLAKNILTGPNMASWLPRFEVDARSYSILCSIHGVGDVAAKGLLKQYGGIAQIVSDCIHRPDALASTHINGKALGKAKASKIIQAMGCEIPGAWA